MLASSDADAEVYEDRAYSELHDEDMPEINPDPDPDPDEVA